MNVHLDKLGAGVEEVGDEVVVDLSEGEVLRAVDTPGHVVTHPGVQTWGDKLSSQENVDDVNTVKVFLWNDMIIVKIQDVVEKVSEFLLLEFCDESPSLKWDLIEESKKETLEEI